MATKNSLKHCVPNSSRTANLYFPLYPICVMHTSQLSPNLGQLGNISYVPQGLILFARANGKYTNATSAWAGQVSNGHTTSITLGACASVHLSQDLTTILLAPLPLPPHHQLIPWLPTHTPSQFTCYTLVARQRPRSIISSSITSTCCMLYTLMSLWLTT